MYGYLGPRSARKFEEFAGKARASGDTSIDVLDARRHLWGYTVPQSGRRTIEVLETAADAGNSEAAKYLITLTRDGSGRTVRRRQNDSREYLERYAGLLNPAEIEQFKLLDQAAGVRYKAGFAKMAPDFEGYDGMKSKWFREQLFSANPNFAVYLLQRRMRERGLYRGSVNGLATKKTVRALVKECRKVSTLSDCNEGPLRPDVISTLLAM